MRIVVLLTTVVGRLPRNLGTTVKVSEFIKVFDPLLSKARIKGPRSYLWLGKDLLSGPGDQALHRLSALISYIFYGSQRYSIMYNEWELNRPQDDSSIYQINLGDPINLYFELFTLLSSEPSEDQDNSAIAEKNEQGLDDRQQVGRRNKSKFSVSRLLAIGKRIVDLAQSLERKGVQYTWLSPFSLLT